LKIRIYTGDKANLSWKLCVPEKSVLTRGGMSSRIEIRPQADKGIIVRMGWQDGVKAHTGAASRFGTGEVPRKAFNRRDRKEKTQRTRRKMLLVFLRAQRFFFAISAIKGSRSWRGSPSRLPR
jgi:hypothetical protein